MSIKNTLYENNTYVYTGGSTSHKDAAIKKYEILNLGYDAETNSAFSRYSYQLARDGQKLANGVGVHEQFCYNQNGHSELVEIRDNFMNSHPETNMESGGLLKLAHDNMHAPVVLRDNSVVKPAEETVTAPDVKPVNSAVPLPADTSTELGHEPVVATISSPAPVAETATVTPAPVAETATVTPAPIILENTDKGIVLNTLPIVPEIKPVNANIELPEEKADVLVDRLSDGLSQASSQALETVRDIVVQELI